MSVATIASSDAIIAVTAPIAATVVIASSDSENTGKNLATRYTPAATIVAAWISADTGVGPAMASGSHTYSGNWALLPMAPPNSSSAATVSVPVAILPLPARWVMAGMFDVPAATVSTKMPN